VLIFLAKVTAGNRHAWWLIVTGLTGGKEQYWGVGMNQSDFGCHQGWTPSRISFFSWWNKEYRVLIFPIFFHLLLVLHRDRRQDIASEYNFLTTSIEKRNSYAGLFHPSRSVRI
jgi:hypothetical protein